MKRVALVLIAMTCLLLKTTALTAEGKATLYPGFPILRESKAYKKFSIRTYSEFSKILYLIDRYSDSQILINYEDQNYTAAFSTTVARWFLSRNYKKQTAREWIKQWCSKSIFANKPIFVKLPDGKFLLAREILEAELTELEQAVRENQAPQTSLAPAVILTAAPDKIVETKAPVPSPSPSGETSAASILKTSPAMSGLAVASAEAPPSKA